MAINEPYKVEILESIKEEPITIYHIGKTLISCFCLDFSLRNLYVKRYFSALYMCFNWDDMSFYLTIEWLTNENYCGELIQEP